MSRFSLTKTGFDRLPGQHHLFLDYIGVQRPAFYPEGRTLDDVERFARSTALPPREALAEALAAQQTRWGGSAENARRLAGGTVAVVAGQQAGLLTAVKLARALEDRGVPAVPVFWIAADDHDLEEISWTAFVGSQNRVERIGTTFDGPEGAPAGWVRHTQQIRTAIDDLFGGLAPSPHLGEVRDLVESAYHPGASPVDAFARMMLALFRGAGLVMADPMDPHLKAFAGDVLGDALRKNGELRGAVLERTRAIRQAGYREQVKVDESFTGLFRFGAGRREAFDPAHANGVPVSELSPNVLLRPVVQDTLFPTAAFVAGPAEIAYLAQAGAAYECLGRAMPPICPRISATLVEPPVVRILDRYGLGFADVLQGPAHLRARVVTASGDGAVFDEVREAVVGELEKLRPALEGADLTLGGALDNSIRKFGGQIDALRSRFDTARARGDQVLEDRLKVLTGRLLPEGKLQERTLNVTPFLVRYGPGLVSLLDEALDLDGTAHQVVEL